MRHANFISLVTIATLATSASAQNAKPTPPQRRDATLKARIQNQIASLEKDRDWNRAAVALIRIGAPAAKPLAAALGAATGKNRPALERRILLIIERIGMPASETIDTLWEEVPEVSAQHTMLACRTAMQVAPFGREDQRGKMVQCLRLILQRGDRENDLLSFSRMMGTLTGRAQISTDEPIARLIKGLSNTKESLSCCQILGSRGRAARSAVPALAKILRAESRRMRDASPRQWKNFNPKHVARAAAQAILAIAPASEEAALAHGFLILHESIPGMRRLAAQELQMLGGHIAAAIPALRELLRSPIQDRALVLTAMNCLAIAGSAGRVAKPEFKKLSQSKDKKIAARAQATLRAIERAAKKKKTDKNR